MQIFLVAIGTHGDVLPLMAVAAELQRRGHAVELAAPAPFAASAERAGIRFHGLGTKSDYDRAIGDPDLWHPWSGVGAFMRYVSALTEETYRWLEARWLTHGGVVIGSPLSLGARIANDVYGVPLVTLHVMPFLIESRHAPPVLPGLPLPRFLPARFRHWLGRGADAYVLGPAALPSLNAFRASLGLPPARRLRHWWNSPDRMLLMFPDWFAAPQQDWPRQAVQVGFPRADRFGDIDTLSGALTDFLDAGEPPLAFTYGSGMRRGQAFFETAVAICRRMGRRGVLLAPQGGQVPEALPAQILHVPYAPFSALLPRCAALIHHGGVGTVAQALAAGIPQLVVPLAFDHFDEAQRLRQRHLGASVSRRRFTARRAAKEIQRLLTARRVVRACAEAKTRMAGADGVPAACDAIERLRPIRA